MPSTYSNLKIQLMSTGENNTTWGDVTNLNLGTAIEEAISGSADVTFASGNVTLTLTDTNASQTARNMRLNCIGTTGGAARNLIVPAIEKMYVVRNGCADAITIKNLTGTGITVPAGQTTVVFNDGTNVDDAVTALSSLNVSSNVSATTLVSTASNTVGLQLGNNSAIRDVTNGGSTIFFDVATGGATHGAFNFRSSNAFASRMYIDSSGNVGVGTTVPTSLVDVVANTASDALVRARNTVAANGFDLGVDNNGNAALWNRNNSPLLFGTFNAERMRIDASGNVGIGTTSPGALLDVRKDQAATTYARVSNLNTGASVGAIMQVVTGTANSFVNLAVVDAQYRSISNGSAVTTAYDDSDIHIFRTNAGVQKFVSDSTAFLPGADNAYSNGTGSFRWSVVYAATGTINTSDEREKEWRGGPTDAEMKAASAIIKEMGFYQWKHALTEKGTDGARYHFGVRAQQVWRIMAEHGLVDPITNGKPGKTPYAFMCWDEWPEIVETKVVKKGRKKVKEKVVVRAAGSRFGLRVEELTMFLLTAMEARLARLEGGAL